MLSVSSLIEFLIDLLRDPVAQQQFANDPQGMLAQHGLDSLTAQDVQDITPMLADHEGVALKHGSSHPVAHYASYHHDDPVRAISQLTNHYEVKTVVVHDSPEYNLTYVDHRTYIDEHPTTTNIQAGGDVNVKDSFNQDNHVNVVKDSFNQDNDGVDNKGGTIDHSPVAGHDTTDSLNSHNDTTATKIDDSGNHVEHNTTTDIGHTDPPETQPEPHHVAALTEESPHEEPLQEEPHPEEHDPGPDDLHHGDLAAAAVA
ncbi:MAG: IniB N-terminal domain-containing protein [Pseudonocardiaceae bacterium]